MRQIGWLLVILGILLGGYGAYGYLDSQSKLEETVQFVKDHERPAEELNMITSNFETQRNHGLFTMGGGALGLLAGVGLMAIGRKRVK